MKRETASFSLQSWKLFVDESKPCRGTKSRDANTWKDSQEIGTIREKVRTGGEGGISATSFAVGLYGDVVISSSFCICIAHGSEDKA